MPLPRVGPVVAAALFLFFCAPRFAYAIPIDYFVSAFANNSIETAAGGGCFNTCTGGPIDLGVLRQEAISLPGLILLSQPPGLNEANSTGTAKLGDLSLTASAGATHFTIQGDPFIGRSNASSMGAVLFGDTVTPVADLLTSIVLPAGAQVQLLATVTSSFKVTGLVTEGAGISGSGRATFSHWIPAHS